MLNYKVVFLNTRPKGRGDSLGYFLAEKGITVINQPLLQLQPLKLQPNAIQQLKQINEYNTIITISPTAAQLGLLALKTMGIAIPASIQLIAVGQATAHVLQQTGLCVQTPRTETSEGLLNQIHISNTSKVMVWAGIGGRTVIQDELSKQITAICRIELYERQEPPHLPQFFDALLSGKIKNPDVVLISSLDVWRVWQKYAQQKALTPILLVLGERTATQIQFYANQQKKNAHIVVLQHLKSEHIFETLQNILVNCLTKYCKNDE